MDLRSLNPTITDINYPLMKINDVIDGIGSDKGANTETATMYLKFLRKSAIGLPSNGTEPITDSPVRHLA